MVGIPIPFFYLDFANYYSNIINTLEKNCQRFKKQIIIVYFTTENQHICFNYFL